MPKIWRDGRIASENRNQLWYLWSVLLLASRCLGLASPDFIVNNESKHVRHVHYSADLTARRTRDRCLLEGPRIYWVWRAGASLVKDTRCERYCGEICSGFQGSIET
jgi:hypothetical protein